MQPYGDIIYHADCRHFRGDIPCVPNKREGVHCEGCPYYDPIDENVLVIKLGAAGDVIRTTPILHRLKKDHPKARIWWLTESPDLVPQSQVDKILKWSDQNLVALSEIHFSRLINLDKDRHACALASKLDATKKEGFLLGKWGESEPADDNARPKFMTGIFDDISLANRRSYPAELFEICGYDFKGEEYIIDPPEPIHIPELTNVRHLVGMNTGAGARWTSRLWETKHWAELATRVIESGRDVILLGGPDEEARNLEIVQMTGGRAIYLGTFPLKRFISVMDKCESVITGVTMAMHIAIGLKKRLVLVNNIFNRYEFGDLYGLGEIIEPDKQCICYFRGQCINPDYFCLDHLPAEKLFAALERVAPLR
jgi:ADP-heptose:LPS heptosyltransferase